MSESPEITESNAVDYAARRLARAGARGQSAHRNRTALIITGLAVLAVIVFALGFEAIVSTGKIHPGVTVAGIEVGGMPPEKARAFIQSGLTKQTSTPVSVVYGEKKWDVAAADIGLTFDTPGLVNEAMRVGRGDRFAPNVRSRLAAWLSGVEIDVARHSTAGSTDSVLDDIAAGTDVPPVDATVKIEGTDPQVIAAKAGLALDRPAAAALLLRAFVSSDRTVEAPVVTAPVAVDDREAAEAAAKAKRILTGPATVTFDGRTWSFEPSQIAKWIAFTRSDGATSSAPSSDTAAVSLDAVISPEKASATVTKALGTKVGRKALSARFKTSNGAVSIVPSRDGVGPDLDALSSELTASLSDPQSPRTVKLRTTITEPKVTTAEAREMGIKRRISVYTTTYASGNKPRTSNIHTLGDALDGTLVAPGKTFSFNRTVGQRTAAKGYQEANAIVNGKLVPQLGGGICQVGTTIFNTVFESGFPVLDRRNHSFYISHYPKGRDATISWGGPDFKFKNDSDHWVLISVSYTSSSITIALYGTDPGYEVEADTSEWRNIKDYPVEKTKDPKLAKGSKIVEDPGVDGRTITVERSVSKDGKVIRTDQFVSVYKPKAEVLRVGTKPVPAATDTPEKTTDN